MIESLQNTSNCHVVIMIYTHVRSYSVQLWVYYATADWNRNLTHTHPVNDYVCSKKLWLKSILLLHICIITLVFYLSLTLCTVLGASSAVTSLHGALGKFYLKKKSILTHFELYSHVCRL